MKKRIMVLFFGIMLLVTALPIRAKADHGPKPSTTVQFVNTDGINVFGTILNDTASSTMWQAYDGTEASKKLPSQGPDYVAAWEAFVAYPDPDNYYFLQRVWKCSSESINWSYFAPDQFKVLLYFPDYDYYAVSDVLKKETMNTVLKVDIQKVLEEKTGKVTFVDISVSPEVLHYDILALIGRVVFTLVIELLLALLFKFKEKRVLILIAVTNLVTQLILNVVLEAFILENGAGFALIGIYLLLEILIFVAEMIVYLIGINKYSSVEHKKVKIVVYSFLANFITFVGGGIVTYLLNMTV